MKMRTLAQLLLISFASMLVFGCGGGMTASSSGAVGAQSFQAFSATCYGSQYAGTYWCSNPPTIPIPATAPSPSPSPGISQ